MSIDKVLIIATSIITDSKGRVLMLQRSKKGSYSGYWQLAEGKVEKAESPQDALIREVGEELGVSILNLEMNSVYWNEIIANKLKYLCFRVVFKVKLSTEKIKISDEHIAFNWFDKEEALQNKLLPGTEDILKNIIYS